MKGKVALVTGGTRGIGKAIAVKFLKEGATVALCGIDQNELDETMETFHSMGEAFGRVVDVSDAGAVSAFVDQVYRTFGSIDILANNAGIAQVTEFLRLSETEWDKIMDVNLKGAYLVAQAVSKVMVAKTGGTIVNMSSTNGLFGEAGLTAYNVSKAGIILLTKTMALELARYGIRVNAVCPGFIATDLSQRSGFNASYLNDCIAKVPLARWGLPEEVADLFVFLASSQSSYITGQSFVIDGGQTVSQ